MAEKLIESRSTGGSPFDMQQLVSSIQGLFKQPGQGGGQMPWQGTPLLDTMAPAPQMGGGGSMAAMQQALAMLAQLMQQRQVPASDPMQSMLGGTGPGY